jgi:hypothetical protein
MRQEKEAPKLNELAVRAALQMAYEERLNRRPTSLVEAYYEIIDEFHKKGLTFAEIAMALQSLGVSMKANTLNIQFAREQKRRSGVKKAMERIHEPDDDSDF